MQKALCLLFSEWDVSLLKLYVKERNKGSVNRSERSETR